MEPNTNIIVSNGWAKHLIERLMRGETVTFRPRGNSMSGKVQSGQLCTVKPIKSSLLKGDIVLCQVHSKQYLHLIKAIKQDMYLIGNNHGKINGWIRREYIFGRLVSVQ